MTGHSYVEAVNTLYVANIGSKAPDIRPLVTTSKYGNAYHKVVLFLETNKFSMEYC